MGNCICVTGKTTRLISGESCNKRRKRSSSVFHDYDDDGEKLLGETNNVTSSSSSSSSSLVRREIKIRMTKKELENLLQNINLKGLSAEEILSKLLFDGGNQIGFATEQSDHHRAWKPALQSIPETD